MPNEARRHDLLRGIVTYCLQYNSEGKVLHSGQVSNYFLDIPLLLGRPYFFTGLLRQLANLLSDVKESHIAGVVSPDFGGTLIAVALQQRLSEWYNLSIPVYRYLKSGDFEGLPLSLINKPLVILDDVMTSGGSVKPIIAHLQHHGANVLQVITAVNRQEGGGEQMLSDMGITLSSVFTLQEILAYYRKSKVSR